MTRMFVLLPLLTVALTAGPSEAQSTPKALPILRGAVQDTLGNPLEGAWIQILGLDRSSTTPASGAYRFEQIKPGKYWVIARRIGYEPLRAALTLNPGDDREVVFQLNPMPHNLPDLKVEAQNKAWERQYQDFLWRSRASYYGYFFTRDDIERSHSSVLGDFVHRYFPYASSSDFNAPAFSDPFDSWRGGLGWNSPRPAMYHSSCPPAVSLNGSDPRGWAVNDFRPEDVEAIEVYKANRVPNDFLYANPSCGLVVIWTK
jgi:hypothetical protein